MSRTKRAAAAIATASAVALSRPPVKPPAEKPPVEPGLNGLEQEVVTTLSLARRQRRLQELADAIGPTAPNRAARRMQDNRARALAKHQAQKNGRR